MEDPELLAHRPTSAKLKVGSSEMEYLGGRGVLEAPPVDRRIEKEFGESLDQDPSRSH